jgi:hypothetical protein
MKRLAGLWQLIVAFDNLLLAYRKARRGKGKKPAVADFSLRLEGKLLTLQQELTRGAYHPGAYRQFTIYEHKPRLISAAPFRDRVVHHARSHQSVGQRRTHQGRHGGRHLYNLRDATRQERQEARAIAVGGD